MDGRKGVGENRGGGGPEGCGKLGLPAPKDVNEITKDPPKISTITIYKKLANVRPKEAYLEMAVGGGIVSPCIARLGVPLAYKNQFI